MRYHEVESVRQSRLLPRLFRRRGASLGRSSRHRKATGPISRSVLDRNQLGFLAAQWAWRTWECAVGADRVPRDGAIHCNWRRNRFGLFPASLRHPTACEMSAVWQTPFVDQADATSVNPDRWSEDPDAE